MQPSPPTARISDRGKGPISLSRNGKELCEAVGRMIFKSVAQRLLLASHVSNNCPSPEIYRTAQELRRSSAGKTPECEVPIGRCPDRVTIATNRDVTEQLWFSADARKRERKKDKRSYQTPPLGALSSFKLRYCFCLVDSWSCSPSAPRSFLWFLVLWANFE